MKIFKYTVLIVVAVMAASELVCRFAIGLGDPPLFQADSAMEFVLQPSKSYTRFHKRFSVNQYAMRADSFPPGKSTPDELRVLVIGDSVMYGGVRIDQANIATEILKRSLQQQYHRPVVVGNGSAKGWGPPDELEYLKRYGTLNADLVVFVFSSHDFEDIPTFTHIVGVASEYPDKKPLLALQDLWGTYLVPRYRTELSTANAATVNRSEADIAKCLNSERDAYLLSRAAHAKVALVQHLTLSEIAGKYDRGYYANQAVAKEQQVPFVDDGDEIRADLKSGRSPYYEGDPIHPNDLGQQVLAHTLLRAVNLALGQPAN
jgi:hypothetical protein